MSDKLLFWINAAIELEQENNWLRQQIQLLLQLLQAVGEPKPEKPVDDCSGNWDEEGEHDD